MGLRLKYFLGILGIAFLSLVHHLSVAMYYARAHNTPWRRLLLNWDGGWYNTILEQGYFGQGWAFFPFYPMTIKFLHEWIPVSTPVIGFCFSVTLFLGFALVVAFLTLKHSSDLLPTSLLAWFLFVYSASSYVFHSHHTESLFLILSFAAFWFAFGDRWVLAAIFAGLAWLTRNQGAFVAFCVALHRAGGFSLWRPRYLKRFLPSVLISACFFSLYPLYQYWVMGNALRFLEEQSHWPHTTGPWSVIQTLWFGNSFQSRGPYYIFQEVYFLLAWIPVYFLWQRNRILSIYCALSLAVMLLQGTLMNTYRFTAVLFPLFFIVGEKCSRWHPVLKGILVVSAFAFNHYVTTLFLDRVWSY